MKLQIPPPLPTAKSRSHWRSGILTALTLVLSGGLLSAADPAVQFRFEEGPAETGGNGITTTNSGHLGGLGTFYQIVDLDWETNLYPVFSTNVPVGTYAPAANTLAVDMGFIQGSSLGGSHGRAIDLMPDVNPPTVGAFPELTICGWVNIRQAVNIEHRLLYANESPNGLGFDLAVRNDNRLSLGINQHNTTTLTSGFQFPISETTLTGNWRFFAVTYNPNLPSGQLKYYFGRQNKLAAFDKEHDYIPPFSTAVDFTGSLALGNFSTVDGGRDSLLGGNSHIFRGLMDEIKIYTNALTLDEIQEAQLNASVTPVAASIIQQPVNTTSAEGQNPNFTVEGTGSGLVSYQWKTNGVDVSGATTTSFTMTNVLLTQSGTTVSVGVSNAVGGVLSTVVTLTVVPADPYIVSMSFQETVSAATGRLTANAGSLGGAGRFLLSSALPNYQSTNKPSGPYAPGSVHNLNGIVYSLPDGGNRAIDLTNNLVSSEGELGSVEALTICGWLNSANNTFRTTSTGRGTGVASATRAGTAGGFVLNYRPNDLGTIYGQNGRLQFHVNEFNVSAGRESSADTILLDTNLPPSNWVFFAVTYDGNATSDNLAYYFGDPNNLATNDVVLTYNRGVMPVTGQLVIGNYQRATGNPTGRTVSGANGAAWRGLIDEVKVFSKVLTLDEIRAQQVAPAVPNVLLWSDTGPNLVFSWETTTNAPYQLQSRTNVAAGSWINVTNAESVVGNVHSVTVAKDKEEEYFRINQQ